MNTQESLYASLTVDFNIHILNSDFNPFLKNKQTTPSKKKEHQTFFL